MSVKKRILNKGFTLIEMVVVVSVIGVLVGVVVATINPQRQKQVAQDGVNRETLSKLSNSIESFYTAEGLKYPRAVNNNPLDAAAADRTVLLNYITAWQAGFIYNLDVATRKEFAIHVAKGADPGKYLKYNSTWKEIRECTNVSSLGSCL